MLIEQNQVLSRIEPNGQGGVQFLYRVNQYGIAAVTCPARKRRSYYTGR